MHYSAAATNIACNNEKTQDALAFRVFLRINILLEIQFSCMQVSLFPFNPGGDAWNGKLADQAC